MRNMNACANRACRYLFPLGCLAMRLTAQPDPSELLLRVRDRVVHTLDRLPRYMCTQTIDRSVFEPAQREVDVKACADPQRSPDTERNLLRTTADRVRLDVGIAAQGEIYSWVGENRFRNRSLFSIVNEGSLSTGYFNGFLDLVFRADNAKFSYSGEISKRGRNLMQYGYSVPPEASHYDFLFHGQRVTTPYEGTVLVDPETAELVRLTLRSSSIPPETGTCEVNNSLSFSRFRLNGSDFLLPSETRLQIKELNGAESDNLTVYSGCHEFLGESTLSFDAPPDAPAQTSATPRAETAIPAGLPFRLALAQNIQVGTAAAGDVVKAVLTSDLRDQAKKVLIPKGTLVSCRILRISRWYSHDTDTRALNRDGSIRSRSDPSARVELLLGLGNFMLPGGQQPVYARLDRGESAPPRRPGKVRGRPVALGPLDAMAQNQWFANFPRAGDSYVIKRGLASNCVTAARTTTPAVLR